MNTLLTVLEPPELRLEGHLIEKLPAKAKALLVYVNIEGRAISRGELESLLFPQSSAKNIPPLLSKLRQRVSQPYLQEHQRRGVIINVPCDFLNFLKLVRDRNYKEALLKFPCPSKPHFLPTFEIDSQNFMDWRNDQHNILNEAYSEALLSRAHELAKEGQLKAALQLLKCLQKHDPLFEDLYHFVIKLELEAKNLAAASLNYIRYQKAFAFYGELEPSFELKRLLVEMRNAFRQEMRQLAFT